MRRLNQSLRELQTLGVPKVRPTILRSFQHDPRAYTQGLCVHEGRLFESTGGDDTSSLREVDPANGRVLRQVPVANDFAEGICLHAGRLFQLMWQSGRVLCYDLDSFAVLAEHRIGHEGWGIASLDGDLFVSDGSSLLRRYQSEMALRGTCRITAKGLPFRHLNALGAANGWLYANIWYSTLIAEIDPRKARLMRLIDCSELARIESSKNEHHVQNGIAYDKVRGSFYLTGKHWARMFEVRLPED